MPYRDGKWYKILYDWDKPGTGFVIEKECDNHHYAWSGQTPCTGVKKCMQCGKPEEETEMSQFKNIKWIPRFHRCAKCGNSTIERVIAGATVRQDVVSFQSTGSMRKTGVEYEPVKSIEDGDDTWFECSNCGTRLVDGENEIGLDGELIEYLEGKEKNK